MKEAVRISMTYLIEFTKLPDDQIFKICIEYWHNFAKKVLQNSIFFIRLSLITTIAPKFRTRLA